MKRMWCPRSQVKCVYQEEWVTTVPDTAHRLSQGKWHNNVAVVKITNTPGQRSSFRICCNAGLVVLNSDSFYLSEEVLISPLNLNQSLTWQSILEYRFSSLQLYIYDVTLFWPAEFLLKNSYFLGFPCMASLFLGFPFF